MPRPNVRALAVLLALLAGACTGLRKSQVEAGLLALPKNAALAARGIERKRASIVLEGEPHELELSWIHVPARAGAHARPLVFVHGTPSTMFNWSALLFQPGAEPALAGECEIYVLDVLGHGQSRASAPPYSFQRCADFVRGFLETLDLHDVTLVGQSYGGEFAWRAALDAPERVSRLVLIDSSGHQRPAHGWLPEEEQLRHLPGARFGYLLNSRERLRPALQLHFQEPLTHDQLEELYLCCENPDNWLAMTQLCCDENGTREAEIAHIRQPTLLLWGARDIAYPPARDGERFQREIVGSKLLVLPQAGHYPHEERVDEVRRALREFHLGI
ncbi:MAG: alpha/beta hydrolase [Planctomycetes bacterium]|nr:alpha/beta hydrolase [Planctomycetota bacterium]